MLEMEGDYVLQDIGGGAGSSANQSDLPTEIKNLHEKVAEFLSSISRGFQNPDDSRAGGQSDRDILEEFHLLESQQYLHREWSIETAIGKVGEVFSELTSLQNRFINEKLWIYRKECQLSQNGLQQAITINLEELQFLSEQLFQIHLILQNSIGVVHSHSQNDHSTQNINSLRQNEHSLLSSLLSSVFIVVEQPPQVIKIGTKFGQPVRLQFLLARVLSTQLERKGLCGTCVKVSVISEGQAKDLVLGNNFDRDHHNLNRMSSAGVLSNDTAKLDFVGKRSAAGSSRGSSESSDHACFVEFRNLKLKKIRRDIKKVKGQSQSPPQSPKPRGSSSSGSSQQGVSVTDEKFALLFQMSVKLDQSTHHIWTLSLPVVVVTHGVQEPQGLATVLWDNRFSSPSRIPFQVPESISWSSVAEILNERFTLVTGHPLDHRSLHVLKSKLLDQPGHSQGSQESVHFARFCKDALGGGISLNFWDWFHNCLKLIEKHALPSWRRGVILGFIGRGDAEHLLRGHPPGTFLLRFSDSMLGGISVCYVASNGNVYSLLPFTTKQLKYRNLSDCIWDLDNLTNLYPSNVPKQQAFPRLNQPFNPFRVPSPSMEEILGVNMQATSEYISSFPRISIPYQFL